VCRFRSPGGPGIALEADGDQLEQLFINLIRNAADASLETGGAVTVAWESTPGVVEVNVFDEGPGIGSTNNLFVPFYTTKQGGSESGLLLSRQIAEAHGGSLTLANRESRPGCVRDAEASHPHVPGRGRRGFSVVGLPDPEDSLRQTGGQAPDAPNSHR